METNILLFFLVTKEMEICASAPLLLMAIRIPMQRFLSSNLYLDVATDPNSFYVLFN